MANLFNLQIKIKGAFMAPFFTLLCLAHLSGYAQTEKNTDYIDYDELTGNVLQHLKEAQAKARFIGSAGLREQALKLPLDSKARVSVLIAPGNQQMQGTQMVNDRRDGVLMIYKYFTATAREPEKVQLYATATALTEDGVCVSNWHVFMGMVQPEEMLAANDSVTFVVTLKGDIYPIERILSFNKNADAAIFKIKTGFDHLSPIPLGNELAVGETVHTLSNPEQYVYYYSKGVVARKTANHKIGPMGNRMEITADYAKGSSGGPILDDKGNMAGMVSTTYSIYAHDQPQMNLQMVVKKTIPAQSIRMLIQVQ
ncbi:S1 family peptidase [Mucilaginibacter sp. FT3.2]|uniref:S1 family peptidase n=1 Tax=Mucilaginibacter sp. FT3.2 TaxID=2723090 RepID=UPI00161823CF|nr:serine protease [Mucilaginibacter sp. FT3.2]MBB6232742.1 S1-C subfamily serine protease [Mucilaginibacter sp. FT3.2]